MVATVNRGAAELNQAIEGSQNKAAIEMGVDQSYLNKIARGERVPGLGMRKKLRDRYGITLDAWDESWSDEVPDTERAGH